MRLKYHDFDSSFESRASYYSAMGLPGVYTGSASQNQQMISWMKTHAFASGAKRIPRSGFYLTNESGPEITIRKSDGAMLERLGAGDMVLNNTMRNNLWDFVSDPSKYLKENVIPNIQTSSGESIVNNIQMDFNLPNVTNSEQFIYELKTNPKVEQIIQEMTLGQVNGRGKLRKYTIS